MTSGTETEPPDLARASALSDGVYAIAITLLVLPLTEIRIRDDHVLDDLVGVRDQLFAMVLSFTVVARFWLLHHEDLRRMTAAGPRTLVANLVHLFFVVVLPFPTSLLADGDSATATIVYALSIVGTSSSGLALWWCAERDGVVSDAARSPWGRTRCLSTTALVAAFLPSIPLALVSPQWARLSWALALPLGLIARWYDRRYRPPGRAVQP